ncbi:hypothetical protein DE146DRAFT_36706 [Phaeosphaeria sp. MPI-PUGE-AT-0046c]|nr:hypothetical protein DE146DRAFT_36706 [Phaeosphaeria sp. MPI-PUGE-AT-0046c]
MFSADLSWSGPNTETVGERRERKARERSSATGSIKTSSSGRSSVVVDREIWWTTGLKKAKGIKSNILRPSSHHSSKSQTPSLATPQKSSLKYSEDVRDPTLQPAWTFSNSLSPTLPSGAPLDLPIYDVPELEGDSSSRRTTSTETRGSPHEHRWQVRTPTKVHIVDEASREQVVDDQLCINSNKRNSVTFADCEATISRPIRNEVQRHPAIGEGQVDFETSQFSQANEGVPIVEEAPHGQSEEYRLKQRPFEWPPISQWQSLAPCVVPKMQLAPMPIANKVAVAHSSTMELTRFQRFIRRMERAGSKIILERLREDWQEASGEEPDEQLVLEKQLWLLTAFQMQILGQTHSIPKPKCDTGRILELYGNLSEVFQISAMYPTQTIHFLTNKHKRPMTLPANVSYLTVRDCGAVPLPYPENYFSHIRAATLPSLVPSSKLPELFRECYKLLAPGGLLEVRVMDATPVRKTAGPLLRTWIDDRLSVNLERLFRCSKPCSLMPRWLEEAGFSLGEGRSSFNVALPCAVDEETADVEAELSTVIGRSLWRDVWGEFVDEVADEVDWWWEDEEILRECRERGTVFDCRAIFAYRQGGE